MGIVKILHTLAELLEITETVLFKHLTAHVRKTLIFIAALSLRFVIQSQGAPPPFLTSHGDITN